MEKIYFSSYRISPETENSDRLNLLKKGLKSDAIASDKGIAYMFLNIETVNYNETDFLTGELIKYHPVTNENVIDETNLKIKTHKIINKVIAKSRFIIDPKSFILMYSGGPSSICLSSFRNKFAKLFSQNLENSEIQLEPIMEEQHFFEEQIQELRSIKKIAITLHASNPGFSKRWKKIDARLKKLGIIKYRETQEGKNIDLDKETTKKLSMSLDGYGKSEITGIDEEGKEKTITTKIKRLIYCNIPAGVSKAIDILRTVEALICEIKRKTADSLPSKKTQ